ncbi:MAG TPA: DUF3617 family protein [Thermoanaerobaculia bacterium]|jgi:hypothetical protein|nr:DUF3617 family protein [Thermoanaerobaculia bacterium]
MKLRHLVLAAAVCAFSLPLLAASPAKAGRWQSTIKIEMAGMPANMQPQTVATCLTKEQAENAENLIPKSGDKRGGCTYTDVKVDGSTISWKMTCAKSGMTGDGTMTYHGESYEGSMHMKIQDRDISATYTGKYVGECDGTEMK